MGTLAVLPAFALGWYAHADYAFTQQEAKLCGQPRWLTEEVSSYLMFLRNYLQAAQYFNYRSLEDLFTATWPLTGISYTNLDTVYAKSASEEGRAALAVMGIS